MCLESKWCAKLKRRIFCALLRKKLPKLGNLQGSEEKKSESVEQKMLPMTNFGATRSVASERSLETSLPAVRQKKFEGLALILLTLRDHPERAEAFGPSSEYLKIAAWAVMRIPAKAIGRK
jgi:hypothetical protein